MKKGLVLISCLLFALCCMLAGCSESHTPVPSNHDARLIGSWKNIQSTEIWTFFGDGTYLVEEGETASWSTDNVGTLVMFGTMYSYEVSEDGTMLTITSDSYSRLFQKQ